MAKAVTPVLPPPPAPGSHCSTSCLCEFDSEHSWDRTDSPFCDLSAYFTSIMSSRAVPVVARVRVPVFLRLNNVLLCAYATSPLSVHLLLGTWSLPRCSHYEQWCYGHDIQMSSQDPGVYTQNWHCQLIW